MYISVFNKLIRSCDSESPSALSLHFSLHGEGHSMVETGQTQVSSF